jgi:hypothetical protein
MNSEFVVLVTWINLQEMEMFKSAVKLNRDSELGQNYMYWGEEDISKLWAVKFDYDDNVKILAIEEIFDIR